MYVGYLDLVTSDDFVGEGKLVLGDYIDEEKSGQESKELSVSLKNAESPKAGNYAGKVKLKVTLLVVPSAKPDRPSKVSLQVILQLLYPKYHKCGGRSLHVATITYEPCGLKWMRCTRGK